MTIYHGGAQSNSDLSQAGLDRFRASTYNPGMSAAGAAVSGTGSIMTSAYTLGTSAYTPGTSINEPKFKP